MALKTNEELEKLKKEKENNIKKHAEEEVKALEREYEVFMTKFEAADEEEQDKMLDELVKPLGIDVDQVVKMFSEITPGNPASKVLADGLGISLPIWLREQMDGTVTPDGYGQLSEFINWEVVENGTMTMDYQDYLPGDSKNPFYGSQEKDKSTKTWLDLTLSKGELVAMETYIADIIYHKQAIVYKSIFTNVHKSEIYFIMQFNNLTKKIGQAKLDFALAMQAKFLAAPENGGEDIKQTDDKITFDPTAYKGPSVTLTGKNMYSLVSQLNVTLRNYTIPSRTHLTGVDEALMAVNINGTPTQLKRSLSLNNVLILAPNEFMEAYDKGIMAGAFQGEAAAINNQVKKGIRPRNYDKLFGAEYGNVTGLQHSLIATDKDTVEGTADLIVIIPGTFKIIQQFDSENTFDLPNNTIAINYWDNNGLMIHKYENDWYLRIRLQTSEPVPAK